jgi:hypothetical protein
MPEAQEEDEFEQVSDPVNQPEPRNPMIPDWSQFPNPSRIPDPGSRPGLQRLRPSATKETLLPPEEELPPSTDYQVKPKMERRRKNTTPLELDLGMQL